MDTTISIIIGAIGVLGSIIYLINETIKERRKPEIEKEREKERDRLIPYKRRSSPSQR